MIISGNGFASFEQAILPNFKINTMYGFKHSQVSNNDYKVIDRGGLTDIYESSITIKGTRTSLDYFLANMRLNSEADNIITLSSFNSGEYIFGEDVDYSSLNCTIIKLSEIQTPSFNVFTINIVIRALAPTFLGVASFPILSRVYGGYSIDDKWSIKKYDSYTSNFTFIEKNNDVGYFNCTALLTRLEMKNLRAFIRTTRGSSFILPPINGIPSPFGEYWGNGNHTVRLLDFEDLGLHGVFNYKVSLKFTTITIGN